MTVHWPVSVGAQVDWNLPQIWRTGLADDRKLLAALATPGPLASLEKDLGPYADGIDESLPGDQNRARFAIQLLETRKPQFMTAYLTALDTEQHASGPDTPASRKTLEGIDALIGQLVAAAQRVHPDGVVAIVSDHGFAPVKQDINFYAPFVLHDPGNAAVKAKVAALLDQLKDDPRYQIDTVLDHDQLVAQGGTPMASWFVLMKIGYELGVTPDAPLPAVRPAPVAAAFVSAAVAAVALGRVERAERILLETDSGSGHVCRGGALRVGAGLGLGVI
ncbi:MAG: hypothetical protein WDW38_010629 [Sanguina aurantia]